MNQSVFFKWSSMSLFWFSTYERRFVAAWTSFSGSPARGIENLPLEDLRNSRTSISSPFAMRNSLDSCLLSITFPSFKMRNLRNSCLLSVTQKLFSKAGSAFIRPKNCSMGPLTVRFLLTQNYYTILTSRCSIKKPPAFPGGFFIIQTSALYLPRQRTNLFY